MGVQSEYFLLAKAVHCDTMGVERERSLTDAFDARDFCRGRLPREDVPSITVLIDIEWIEENNVSSVTQLAAVRVTENWEVEDTFERLVCPENYWNTDWEHIAYSGYSPEEFLIGVSEKTCILDFIKFLRHDDSILCWQRDTKHLLMQKVERFSGMPLPANCKSVNQSVYDIAKSRGIKSYGLYEVVEKLGIATPVPMHRSTNDVAVMRSLLSALGYGKKAVRNAPAKTADRRARNADILSRVEYNYIFSPASKVFHRPSCHLMRNAIDIEGCIYYKTAIKARVPCRVCRPEPNEQPQKTEVNEASGKEADSSQSVERKLISVKLLGNKRVEIANVKIVGFCHNLIHPGKMTRKIMEEHDCLVKNCKFFEKNNESPYWAAEEKKKRQKEERKQIQQAKKEAAQKLEDELAELKDLFQSYADDAGYAMLIVRLEKEWTNRYKIFYVSENPFADGNRFPDFLSTIKFFFPQISINMRHIRDVDGHFVTIPEYLSRKR